MIDDPINTLRLKGVRVSYYFPKEPFFHKFEKSLKGKVAKTLERPKVGEGSIQVLLAEGAIVKIAATPKVGGGKLRFF